ncbi:MAG: 4-hydroxy-tetrahydrodipicolinate synthase [Kineosporiaceae bacterium]|nr:4-hydroxy-tetrahydrodipicolinate synthase [Kineosporiaceae bacterium]
MSSTAAVPAAPASSVRRPFGSVLTAMVTPFTAAGDLDLDGAQALAAHLVATGHDGIVVSGTTGESPTTSDTEKDALLRAVLDAVGEQATIVAGVGTNDTRHTIELAEAAAKAGAHGLLVVTPYYNKPPAESLVAHFTAVADATDLPCMLYDIPGRAGVRITTPVLRRLADHPRITAVKDATGDLVAGMEVMASTDLAYYCGDDALNLPWLSVGAVGVVSVVGHVAGARHAALVAAVDAGDLATARQINAGLIGLTQAIMSPASQGAIRSKAAMELLGVIGSRATRLPLLAASPAEVDVVRQALTTAGMVPSS